MKVLKYAISETNENLGLTVLRTPYIVYKEFHFFGFNLGSFGALCKILILRFSKGYSSHSFRPVSTKFYRKYVIGGNTGYQYYFFWRSAKF